MRLRSITLCIRVTSKISLKINCGFRLFHRSYLEDSHQVHLINLLNCSEKIGCPLILFYVIFKGRLSLSSSLSFHHFLTRSPPVVRCSCLEKLRQGHFWSPYTGSIAERYCLLSVLKKAFFCCCCFFFFLPFEGNRKMRRNDKV